MPTLAALRPLLSLCSTFEEAGTEPNRPPAHGKRAFDHRQAFVAQRRYDHPPPRVSSRRPWVLSKCGWNSITSLPIEIRRGLSRLCAMPWQISHVRNSALVAAAGVLLSYKLHDLRGRCAAGYATSDACGGRADVAGSMTTKPGGCQGSMDPPNGYLGCVSTAKDLPAVADTSPALHLCDRISARSSSKQVEQS